MITTRNTWFTDPYGRRLILRGVNLDGKVPFRPDGATWRSEHFFDHADISFVGRPFPLADADRHYSRLRHWGFSMVRFLVPWEAIEHKGPGQYDEAYLDYLYAMIKKAGDYDLHVLIDARQDMFSRFTGGDGAPGWVFEAMGMDITRFKETGAAITHQTHGDPFPKQVWGTNQYKYAAATMFTLFFAGNDFAPGLKIQGVPVQEFLQKHWINAYQQVLRRLDGLSNILGINHMNEPRKGYIECADLADNQFKYIVGDLMKDAMPSPFEGMALASGFPCTIEVWQPFPRKKIGIRLVNPEGTSLWNNGHRCPWRDHGVWDIDYSGNPVLLRPDYFHKRNGAPVNFARDYLKPFFNRFITTMRTIRPEILGFMNLVPAEEAPAHEPGDPPLIVSTDAWFDGINWGLKRYIPVVSEFLGFDWIRIRPVIGLPGTVRRSIVDQLNHYKQQAAHRLGGVPSFLTEIGICYDINDKKAYRTGDFTAQSRMLDRMLGACDTALMSYAIWTYNAGNTNERGDHWNDEDFSIFSLSQRTDPSDINSGGRALDAIVRPYPRATAGEPIALSFSRKTKIFNFRFRSDPDCAQPTEIFVPVLQYPKGFNVTLSDGNYSFDDKRQLLIYTPEKSGGIHWVGIGPKR